MLSSTERLTARHLQQDDGGDGGAVDAPVDPPPAPPVEPPPPPPVEPPPPPPVDPPPPPPVDPPVEPPPPPPPDDPPPPPPEDPPPPPIDPPPPPPVEPVEPPPPPADPVPDPVPPPVEPDVTVDPPEFDPPEEDPPEYEPTGPAPVEPPPPVPAPAVPPVTPPTPAPIEPATPEQPDTAPLPTTEVLAPSPTPEDGTSVPPTVPVEAPGPGEEETGTLTGTGAAVPGADPLEPPADGSPLPVFPTDPSGGALAPGAAGGEAGGTTDSGDTFTGVPDIPAPEEVEPLPPVPDIEREVEETTEPEQVANILSLVHSPAELIAAIAAGAEHIELRAHIDMRTIGDVAFRKLLGSRNLLNFDTSRQSLPDVKSTTRSIKANCDAAGAPVEPGGVLLQPLRAGTEGGGHRQCAIYAPNSLFHVTETNQKLWVDNVYMRATTADPNSGQAPEMPQVNMVDVGSQNAEVFVTDATLQSDGGMATGVHVSENARALVERSNFHSFGPNTPAIVTNGGTNLNTVEMSENVNPEGADVETTASLIFAEASAIVAVEGSNFDPNRNPYGQTREAETVFFSDDDQQVVVEEVDEDTGEVVPTGDDPQPSRPLEEIPPERRDDLISSEDPWLDSTSEEAGSVREVPITQAISSPPPADSGLTTTEIIIVVAAIVAFLFCAAGLSYWFVRWCRSCRRKRGKPADSPPPLPSAGGMAGLPPPDMHANPHAHNGLPGKPPSSYNDYGSDFQGPGSQAHGGMASQMASVGSGHSPPYGLPVQSQMTDSHAGAPMPSPGNAADFPDPNLGGGSSMSGYHNYGGGSRQRPSSGQWGPWGGEVRGRGSPPAVSHASQFRQQMASAESADFMSSFLPMPPGAGS